jgi:hypothetical protein
MKYNCLQHVPDETSDFSRPSQLCHLGNLQVRARPLTAKIQPLQKVGGFYSPPGSVTCVVVAACT